MNAGGEAHESVYGQWAGLATTATTYALAAAGLSAGGPAVALIASMAGLGDAQTKLLASIKKDTKLLRGEPFRTARTLLAEAARVGRHDSRYASFIDDALASFYRAHSLASSARELAVVEFDIALLYLATGKQRDAQHWIDVSRTSCRDAVDDLVSSWVVPGDASGSGFVADKRVSARPELRIRAKRAFLNHVALYGHMATFGLSTIGDKDRRERAIGTARDLISFANLVEHVAARERGEQAPPPLDIEENGRDLALVMRSSQ